MNSELKEFAKYILQQSFEGGDIAGDDAQEKAHELGLLKVEIFDPNIHTECQNTEVLEPGDDIYLFTEKLI